MRRTNWDLYREENIDPKTRRHKKFPRWRVVGIWQFERDDGARTHHKIDTPCPFWRDACEWSMEYQDTGKDPHEVTDE